MLENKKLGISILTTHFKKLNVCLQNELSRNNFLKDISQNSATTHEEDGI